MLSVLKNISFADKQVINLVLSLCPRCEACPELAVALSVVEGMAEWVEWIRGLR